jgi:hypothetical protein
VRPDTAPVGIELPDIRDTAEELHVCPACASTLVYPLEWAPVDMRRWRVELRCPDCEWTKAGLYEQEILDRFDQVLDAATDSLVVDLRRLQRANMEDELERFNMALGQDLILPEDF